MYYFKNVHIVKTFVSNLMKGKSCLIGMIKELDFPSGGVLPWDPVGDICSSHFLLHMTCDSGGACTVTEMLIFWLLLLL